MTTRSQQIYADIATAIGKALKPRGFLKRGHRFGRRHGDDWAVIDLQKNTATTSDNIRFAINLGVWFRDLEDLRRPAPPAIMDCHWWDRIGDEPPERSERWWIIDRETEPALLAGLVVRAIEGALPHLDAHLDEAAVLARFVAGRTGRGFRIGRNYEARVREVLEARGRRN